MAGNVDKKYLTTICKRHNIELTQNKISKIFNLDFLVNTRHSTIKDIFTFEYLFNLLNTLDQTNEFIESSHILNKNHDNSYDILIIFKHVGANMGLLKKYLSFNLKKSTDQFNNITMNAVNINCTSELVKDLDKINLYFGDMTIVPDKNTDSTTTNRALIHLVFNLEIYDDMPKMIVNFVKLVMKNMVLKLQEYIETL
tara:strand:- start:41 stop:634 length:594 start_codon:yes stop_codon:yes gene_type:complete